MRKKQKRNHTLTRFLEGVEDYDGEKEEMKEAGGLNKIIRDQDWQDNTHAKIKVASSQGGEFVAKTDGKKAVTFTINNEEFTMTPKEFLQVVKHLNTRLFFLKR